MREQRACLLHRRDARAAKQRGGGRPRLGPPRAARRRVHEPHRRREADEGKDCREPEGGGHRRVVPRPWFRGVLLKFGEKTDGMCTKKKTTGIGLWYSSAHQSSSRACSPRVVGGLFSETPPFRDAALRSSWRAHMLHCVVVALSTGFTSLHAPLLSPHVHRQSVARPVLHQRAAAAVGVPAVGDEDAAECRASAMEAQSKESGPVAVARAEMKQELVHHDAAPCWSQGCRVRRQKGDPAPAAQLLCDNRGPIQVSSISLGSGMGPMQRAPRRALRPVMLADDGRVGLQRVAIALFLPLLLFPDAHNERHAFNILYMSLFFPFFPNSGGLVRNFCYFAFLSEIGLYLNELGQYIYRA